MLDISAAIDTTGNTALTPLTTAATGEKHLVNNTGLNPYDADRATTVAFGALAINATDAVKEVQLQNQDENDTLNYSDWKPTGTSVAIASPVFLTSLKTANGRLIQYAQLAAGKIIGYMIDHYDSGFKEAPSFGSYLPFGNFYSATMAAQTASSWATNLTWAPAKLPPAGKYALLGLKASALTNFALFGFEHPDFGPFRPGIPVGDYFTTTTTKANSSSEPLIEDYSGFQFVRMSELTKKPQCPVFNITKGATNLNIFCLDNTADTPTVILNLQRLS